MGSNKLKSHLGDEFDELGISFKVPPPKPDKVEMPRLLENPFTGEKIETEDTMSMGKGFFMKKFFSS